MASFTPVDNTDSCSECSEIFPYHPIGWNTLCGLCKVIGNEGEDAAKSLKQCAKCGGAWKQLRGELCGSCRARALRQTAADDTFDDNRRAATEARLNNVRPSTNTSTTSSQGTGQADRRSTVTSAVPSMYSGPGNLARDLNNARNLVGSDRYLITLEARCTNLGAAWKEENKFAPQGNDFNSTEPFAQVLDALFEKVVGPWWKQAEDAPLARKHVTFLLHTPYKKIQIDKDQFIQANSEGRFPTLGSVIHALSQSGDGAYLKSTNPKSKKALVISLTADINGLKARKEYEKQATTIASKVSSALEPKRRKVGTSSDFGVNKDAMTPSSKLAMSTLISSQLSPTKRVQYNIDTSTSAVIPIEFRRQYGRFNGSSPAFYQQGRVESGTITVLPFNTTGLTKNVHLLTVDSIRYAAKQVKYDGTGTASRPKHISTKENLQYLEGELLTSACLASVVEHFTWVMKDVAPGIPIYPFVAAQTWILKEVTEHADRKQHWLIEPLLDHTADVMKFSGSLGAGNNTGLMGATADTLAHFSVVTTKRKLLLADLQGLYNMPARKDENDNKIFTLFDTMVHFADTFRPIDFGTFLGDQGDAAIERFLQEHECNLICRAIGLDVIPLEADDNEDDDEDEDDRRTPATSGRPGWANSELIEKSDPAVTCVYHEGLKAGQTLEVIEANMDEALAEVLDRFEDDVPDLENGSDAGVV